MAGGRVGRPGIGRPEVRRWYEIARHHYQDLWYTDHAIITAAFALARIHLAYGEVEQALVGLDEVPSTVGTTTRRWRPRS